MNYKDIRFSKYFKLWEVVPYNVLMLRGELGYELFDPRYAEAIDFIREFFGVPVIGNTYLSNGILQERGFRMPNTKTGALLSQHKFGRAFDFNVRGLSPEKTKLEILDNQFLFLEKGWSTLEDQSLASTWTHIDMRDTNNSNKMKIIYNA